MKIPNAKAPRLVSQPLTNENWQAFEKLFGPKGACAGCWCMWFRLARSQWEQQKGEGNKRAMRRLVRSGQVPGILAYHQGEAIAWCSVAPREAFPLLQRSRMLKPVDEHPVWSIVCLFLRKDHRRQGITVELVRAAVAYAAAHGANLIEAYPIDTDRDNYPVAFAPGGFVSTFRRAGFKEVLRRSETRPIMRFQI